MSAYLPSQSSQTVALSLLVSVWRYKGHTRPQQVHYAPIAVDCTGPRRCSSLPSEKRQERRHRLRTSERAVRMAGLKRSPMRAWAQTRKSLLAAVQGLSLCAEVAQRCAVEGTSVVPGRAQAIEESSTLEGEAADGALYSPVQTTWRDDCLADAEAANGSNDPYNESKLETADGDEDRCRTRSCLLSLCEAEAHKSNSKRPGRTADPGSCSARAGREWQGTHAVKEG
jgi:hypothetical protein